MIIQRTPLKLILDTNIVIYTQNDITWKDDYMPILQDKILCIGFMTVAELLESAYQRNLSAKNIQGLKDKLVRDYAILPFCEEICDQFARIRVERRNRPISVPDALIAATALTYELPLLSIAVGPDMEKGEVRGHAKGIIAIGDIATGIFVFGGCAVGLFAFGGCAISIIAAVGGAAIGGIAVGGVAIGVVAAGGSAIGYYYW